MMQATDTPPVTAEVLSADAAAQVMAFARTAKAAARAVSLYPAEHPAVSQTLTSLASVAGDATAGAALRLMVLPDSLTIDGRRLPKPDKAVTELAALLHAHQIGEMIVEPFTDVDLWRRFLALLAVAPEQLRLRGGLARLWASEGQTRIEVRRIDYNELLRVRIRGERATWQAIVANCLEGDADGIDDGIADVILSFIETPDRAAELVKAIEERGLPGEGRGPLVVAGLMQAVAQFVEQSQPEQLEDVLGAEAEATARLPVATLGPMMVARRSGMRPALAEFMTDLVKRVKDSTIADVVATEVREGRGTSVQLAEAFCGLAPDPDRRTAILAMARKAVEQPGATSETATESDWQQSEEMVLAYSHKRFVSDAYNADLQNLTDRAVDLDRDLTDPPERLATWTQSIDDARVRLLDAQVLVDLMTLQDDIRRWRELSELAIARIAMLVVVGDFPAATYLVESFREQSRHHKDPGVRTAASQALEHTLNTAVMRHVASHLDTNDPGTVTAARQFCRALGTVVVGPLAEVLSREERTRSRQHLIDILIELGAAGSQAVERLKLSANAAVRRTAVLLLREFGGEDALPDLEALLTDAESHVQRDATRAILALGTDAAYHTLIQALVKRTETSRFAITGVLWALPNEDVVPLLAHFLCHAPRRGSLWTLHDRAIQRLASAGGHQAIEALIAAVFRRSAWAPFKTPAMQLAAVDALARIGSPEAITALRGLAADGPRHVRSAARRQLNSVATPVPTSGGTP